MSEADRPEIEKLPSDARNDDDWAFQLLFELCWAGDEHDFRGVQSRAREALRAHNVLVPKRPWCDACQMAHAPFAPSKS